MTIEVKGSGNMHTLDDSRFEQAPLPGKGPATIAALRAELEVGQLVIVTQGDKKVSERQGRLWQILIQPAHVVPASAVTLRRHMRDPTHETP
ncbi:MULTISPECIES: hypothetical protein [unclassified Streptomyces]|uniref:hypothetical protein n=1 Tax=unclassified Streptomyces TaxID=2593676 RepID=UPI00288A11A9|nr:MULTISPECIES: hypothetical protein [unclassified Streptomyces]WNI30329.1 hypothetical protein RLT59_17140 [Streptomyces sp. ITFR-6]WSJ24091.1 hypothetical protein OG384_20000 [Streptomyces sp. NBC_01324]